MSEVTQPSWDQHSVHRWFEARLQSFYSTSLPARPLGSPSEAYSHFLKSEEQRHCYGGSTSRRHNIFRGTGDVIREGNAIRPEFSIFHFVVTTKWGLWQLARNGESAETSWHDNSTQSRGYCCSKACCQGRGRGRCMVDAKCPELGQTPSKPDANICPFVSMDEKIAWHGGSCL